LQAPVEDEFAAAIAELERAAGEFLAGPGLGRCRSAFERDPDAFRFLVAKTLRRQASRSLLGLFVRIVDDEHRQVSERLARQRQSSAPGPRPVAGSSCWIDNCESRVVGIYGGQAFCARHLAENAA
jgi:hypothetical protein